MASLDTLTGYVEIADENFGEGYAVSPVVLGKLQDNLELLDRTGVSKNLVSSATADSELVPYPEGMLLRVWPYLPIRPYDTVTMRIYVLGTDLDIAMIITPGGPPAADTSISDMITSLASSPAMDTASLIDAVNWNWHELAVRSDSVSDGYSVSLWAIPDSTSRAVDIRSVGMWASRGEL